MSLSVISSRHHSSGFTLIEVLCVLIILGIAAAVAIPRGNIDTDLRKNSDILSSHLRYAQSRAMAMEEPWGLVASNGTYTMFKVASSNIETVPLPGESEPAKKVADGRWWFDAQGHPHSGDDTVPPATEDISITVLDKEAAVIITAITGYIQ